MTQKILYLALMFATVMEASSREGAFSLMSKRLDCFKSTLVQQARKKCERSPEVPELTDRQKMIVDIVTKNSQEDVLQKQKKMVFYLSTKFKL